MKRMIALLAGFAGIALLAAVTSLVTAKKTEGVVAAAVQVVNTPLPVNTESPAKIPFQMTLSDLQRNYSVPADKRLVIEFATGNCDVEARNGAAPFLRIGLLTYWNGVASGATIPHTFLAITNATGTPDYFYDVATPLKTYADPGSMLTLTPVTIGSDTVLQCPITFSGYLINP